MTLDALAFAILLLFGLLGAHRGALVSGLSLLSIGAGYGAGLLAAYALGPYLASGLGSLLGYAVAGGAGFLAVSLACGAAARSARQRDAQRHPDLGRPFLDRLGGALFGLTRGALVVVLLSWLVIWYQALDQLQRRRQPAPSPPSASLLVAERAVEKTVNVALANSGAGADLAGKVLARPAETLTDLRSLLEEPAVTQLASDRVFWGQVEQGAVEGALNRLSFTRIAYDRRLRSEFAAVGLVDEAAGADAEAFRDSAREVLERIGPIIGRLRSDPELARLAQDPEVAYFAQRRDILALLQHRGFRRLVSRLLAEGAETARTKKP
jgi:uncharacterized membrane protein required for colicin V production